MRIQKSWAMIEFMKILSKASKQGGAYSQGSEEISRIQ